MGNLHNASRHYAVQYVIYVRGAVFAFLPKLIHIKGLRLFPNHRLSCQKLSKSPGVSMQKGSIVNNEKRKKERKEISVC